MTAVNQDVGVDAPFIQGDTLTLQVPVFEADGTTPTDLSAASAIRWEVTRSIGGVPVVVEPPLVVKELGSGITVGDPAESFQVVIDPADSEDLAGTYHHEAEALFVTGVRSTVLTGRWVVQRAGVKPAA